MNANNTTCSLTKHSQIATLALAGRSEKVQEASWTELQDSIAKLLLKIP